MAWKACSYSDGTQLGMSLKVWGLGTKGIRDRIKIWREASLETLKIN